MKLIGISCVRDEVDIIESFVRHNLNFVDKLVVVDNLSRDGTLEILVKLQNEGLSLDIRTFASNQHDQEVAIATVLNTFPLSSDGFTHAVLLDADEFISAESKENFLNALSTCSDDSYPVMEWKTYIPDVSYLLPYGKCITQSMRLRREPEGNAYYKAIVPRVFFGNCIVGKGNHIIGSNAIGLQAQHLISCKLAHFPIRTPEQALCKLILGSHTLSRKRSRGTSEGLHWDNLAEKLRASDYQMSPEILVDFAVNYAQSEVSGEVRRLIFDPMISFDCTDLKYTSQSRISILQRFDRYIKDLCN